MEHQGLHAPPARTCFGDLVIDDVEVSPVKVDLGLVETKPSATVEDPATPLADLGDRSCMAEPAHVGWSEVAPVVDADVPVTVLGVSSCSARTPEGNGFHS